jgi:Tat protein secretion system quality control protein TatD with DNase activity
MVKSLLSILCALFFCRNTGGDFYRVLKAHRHRIKGAVVHSFTGDENELRDILSLDVFVGINGCSLKTEETLANAKIIPLKQLMLETDAPWCDIRPTSAGFKFVQSQWPSRKREKFEQGICVKNRNEPCHIRQVLEVVAGVRGEPLQTVAAAVYDNVMTLFFNNTTPNLVIDEQLHQTIQTDITAREDTGRFGITQSAEIHAEQSSAWELAELVRMTTKGT